MVRTIKAKTGQTLKKGDSVILLPGTTGAEPWELWKIGGGETVCLQSYSLPADNPLRRTSTLTLPVAQVFCLPLWLNDTDEKHFAEMIPLQLELRGFQPRSHSPVVFDFSVAVREATRTLVLIGILPSTLPDEFQSVTYQAFDLSVRYFPLPENALTLWQERDELVAAVTRGPHLVYFQALGETGFGQRVLQDLRCILESLEMHEISTPLRQVVVWNEATSAEVASLQETLHLPVQQAERPAPQIPSTPWKLVPATVMQARQHRETRRWKIRAALIVLIVYLLFVAWMVTQFFLTSRKVDDLQQWTTQHAQALSLVHDTQAAWKDLAPVVDEKDYPLELLRRITVSVPSDQLQLTDFQAGDGHILIKGQAKNVAAAYQFRDSLVKDPSLANCTWEMGQPQILPNDLAKFQIDGTFHPGGSN